ncbi:MAG: hypothetical protein ACSW8G_03230 [Bacillota bacterium]
MDNKRTPVSSILFYIAGLILLIISLFMLWTAVSYTKTYLQSYDASFSEMWSNSIQYVITQFVPYFGMGVICLGLGRAIAGSASSKAAEPEEEDSLAADLARAAKAKAAEEKEAEAADLFDDLVKRIDANREVLSIKIEEKEKRDSFRIKELEKKVDGFLEDIKYINEPLEELVYKQAAGISEEPAEEEATEAPAAAPGPVPQFFRVAKAMTMPECPAVKTTETDTADEAAEPAAASAAPGAVPQFFRVAKVMTMPACPAVKSAEAAGAVPPVFRVARTMTMTV